MFHHSNPSKSKITTRIVLSLFLATVLFSSAPRPASAQLASVDAPANIWTSIVTYADSVYQSVIKPAGEWAWEHGAATAFRNMAKSFTQQIAYNAAVQLASGGEGQTPLFTWKGLGDVIKDAGDDALGDAIDNFTKKGLGGFSLCDSGPNMPEFKLIIGMYLFNEADVRPKKANCSFSKMKGNIERLSTDPRYKDQFLKNFGAQFDPKQNQLGMTLDIQQNILKDKRSAEEKALDKEKINQGFKDITEPITGFIKSPAQSLKADREFTMSQIYNEPLVFTGDILADALGVFTQTFAARFQKKLLEGVVPSPSKLASKRFGGGPGGSPSGVDYAVQVNTSISTVSLTSGDTLDVISEFSNCTQNPEIAPVNNCTIDSKFGQALRSADEGKPLTVQEAIDKGLINSSWGFKELRPAGQRTPDAWYLSDLKKLRKARIIPVGWELAAEKIINSNSPETTLQAIMGSKEQNYGNGFNERDAAGGCNQNVTAPTNYDNQGGTKPWKSAGKYCGLIDPNWLLKAPASQCRLQGFGQQLEPLSGSRAQTCVDVQNCVSEKADGTCQAWGYCTREKNIWRLGGDSCEFPENSGYSPYATCQTFSSREGDTVSYLKDSLNSSGCDGSTFGCRGYYTKVNTGASVTEATRYLESGEPNVTDLAITITGSSNNSKIYLRNQESYSCDSKDEGCRQFLRLGKINQDSLSSTSTANPVEQIVSRVTGSNSETYQDHTQAQERTPTQPARPAVEYLNLKSAPAYLNCYNVYPQDTLVNGVFYLAGSFKTDDDSPECRNYLALCKESEVGCDMYDPKAGGPTVPAVAKSEDICPGECIGFNTYTELKTHFSPQPEISTTNFIPADGQKCSAAEVGCAEFTNIVAGERKEYYSYVRSCIKPDEKVGNDLKAHTYYTWVGSETTGYQLKTWLLESDTPDNQDSPPKTDNDPTDNDSCVGIDGVFPTSDPDCKQFYTTTGQVSYRLASETITADNSCTEYRKTRGNDTEVLEEANCLAKSGVWKPDASGQNACFYNFIPSEAKSCSARAVSCREYKGPTADNVKLVFPISVFGSGPNDEVRGLPNDTTLTGGWVGGDNVNESTLSGGRSYKISGSTIAGSTISKDLTGKLISGKQYLLTFWARNEDGGSDLLDAGFKKGGVTTAIMFDREINNSWQIYSGGPITINNLNSNDVISLTIIRVGNTYIDNIQLKEISDTFYVVKDSWKRAGYADSQNAPATCYSEKADGTPDLTNARELRCAAYTNRARQTVPVKSFSSLCRVEAAGCEALVDTRNSSSPRGEEVVKDNQTVTTPDDQVVYRVFDVKKSCAPQAKACTRLGKAEGTSSTGTVNKWADEFLRIDPDTFSSSSGNSPLCSGTADRCEKYTFDNANGNTEDKYFKDPGDDVCEYKQSAGSVGYAWYKKGSANTECNLVCSGGANAGTPCINDSICSGGGKCKPTPTQIQTQLCPSDQSSCTEFKDPVKQNSYYYLNNKKLDKTSCGGQVSEVQGCLLFNDTSESSAKWSAQDSYTESKNNDNKLVVPKNTGTLDSNTIIKVRRDRVCSEWLACQSETTRFMGNKPRTVCQSLGKCNQWGDQGVGKCSSWVENDPADLPKPLNSVEYQSRIQRGEIVPDYSGYSIPNLYPLDVLGEKNYSDGIKLTYIKDGVDKGLDGAGTDINGTGGLHQDKLCRAYPAADSPYQAVEAVISDSGWKSSCQTDNGSPCPLTPENDIQLPQDKKQAYKDASVCQKDKDGNLLNCECFYKKANYSSGDTLYYGFEDENSAPPPFFRAGDADNNSKSKLKKQDTLIGLRGYCLEKDPSRLVVAGNKEDGACLTWYPSDIVTGDISVYDYNPGAGLQNENLQYCVEARGNSRSLSNPVYSMLLNSGNIAMKVNNWNTIGWEPVVGEKWYLSDIERITFGKADSFSSGGTQFSGHWCGGTTGNQDCGPGSNGDQNSVLKPEFRPNEWSNIPLDNCGGNNCWYKANKKIPLGTSTGDWWWSSDLKQAHMYMPGNNNDAYFAIIVDDLDNPKEILKIIVGGTDGGGDPEYAIVTPKILFREYCKVVATGSKPWTNRLLGKSFDGPYESSISSDGYYGSVSKNSNDINKVVGIISNGSNILPQWSGVTSAAYSYEEKGLINEGLGVGVCIGADITGSSASLIEGSHCTNSIQCKSGICGGRGELRASKSINNDDGYSGYKTLVGLFSYLKDLKIWSFAQNKYIDDSTSWDLSEGHDVNYQTYGKITQPAIKQVVYNNNARRQPSEGAAGFTLQASSIIKKDGDLTVTSPAAVSAQFYAYNPNGEQMPLREVWVDWGDNKKSGASGKYKNHKNVCKTSSMCSIVVKDPSFESGVLAPNWQADAGTNTSIGVADVLNPAHSGKFLGIQKKSGTNSSVSQYLGILKKGKTYSASVWYKKFALTGSMTSTNPRGKLWLGDASGVTPYTQGKEIDGAATFEWQKLTVTLTPTSDDEFHIFLYSVSSGASDDTIILYDDVVVEEITQSCRIGGSDCNSVFGTGANAICATNSNYNFGDSSQACQADSPSGEGYFNFTHVYTCSGTEPCTFYPKVMVQDNWGWCTGRKDGVNGNDNKPGTPKGYWNTNYNDGDCKADNLSAAGWFTFPGKVTVKPKP
ncbi:MAG: hypothetical protein AAB657_01485 [Patescibacteria group bacterium]